MIVMWRCGGSMLNKQIVCVRFAQARAVKFLQHVFNVCRDGVFGQLLPQRLEWRIVAVPRLQESLVTALIHSHAHTYLWRAFLTIKTAGGFAHRKLFPSRIVASPALKN